jgi:lipoprotein-anchoring transpeptidase ErfK/SrfK
VKRLHAVVLFVLGFAVAGVFSGTVIADVTTSTSTSTVSTTTAETTTTTTTTTTAPPPSTHILPAGVRVAGVRVGGLSPADAVSAVELAFQKPLSIVVDRSTLVLQPTTVASAYAATAVAKARISATGTNVPLVVAVRGPALHQWVAAVQKRFARKPVDASLKLKNGAPSLTKDKPGRAVNSRRLYQRVVAALKANSRLPLRVRTAAIAPKVTVGTYKETIVINRGLNRLDLYDGDKLTREFKVATGQAIYPTPKGVWHIVVKWKNPTWYPPTQDAWAKGLKPVPPGPNNPLGTRWMGLDAPGVGIHGTDEPASIGYSESHGCIRMQVPDSEWLFDHVEVGTTVYIL